MKEMKNMTQINATIPISIAENYTYVQGQGNLVIMSGQLSVNNGTPSAKEISAKLSDKYKKTWETLSKM